MSAISAQGSVGSMMSSDYAVDMARAWRTDNVAQDPMKGETFGRPEFVRAPSQAFTPPAAPLAPPPSPTAAIEAFMRGMEERLNQRQDQRTADLSRQITVLSDEVRELRTTVVAINKQVSNLTSMGFCDKVKSFHPCYNHLQKVAVRGLSAKELDLVQKSKTIQLEGAK
jgi:hypothetical protein